MPLRSKASLLHDHQISPNNHSLTSQFNDIFKDSLWRPNSKGGLMPPLWVQGKSLVGRPGTKAPGSSKNLVLWNHLLLIKIYPPKPVLRLVQHIYQGSTYLFKVLLWKVILLQAYVKWTKMKTYSPTNFPSP